MKNHNKKQKGTLLIAAAALIVMVSVMSAGITYIATTKSAITSDRHSRILAFYIAESGLQHTSYNLNSGNISCAELNGHVDYTNINFNNGQFTVTTNIESSIPSLTSSINSSVTTIPISSLSGITPTGQVMIDREFIDYSDSSSEAGDCSNNQPCLVNVTRGAAGSTAASHASGTPVAQRTCQISSTAGLPDLSNPHTKSTASAYIKSMPYAWLIGKQSAGGETLASWNSSSWEVYPISASIPDQDLNALSMLSYADVWAVGKMHNSNALILHWDGSTWTQVLPNPSINKDLEDVYCISNNDCWSVGQNRTFIHWSGSNWSEGNVKTNGNANSGKVPNKRIYTVDCTSSSSCWAGGAQSDNDALFVYWDGSIWKRVLAADPSVASKNIYSIHCANNNDCWSVGQKPQPH